MSSPQEQLEELRTTSGLDPRDASKQQLGQFREILEKDLFLFAWHICGFTDLVPEIHGKLASLIGRWGEPSFERIMIQIPREFFKTSLCTIANSAWQMIREPDEPIVVYNEKQENAEMWVRTVRDIFATNRLLQLLWPELLPPGVGLDDRKSMPRSWKWNDTEINLVRGKVQPESSLSAKGVSSAAAGRHWPKMIMDDLIAESAANSPAVMDTVRKWVDKAVYLERPALKGRVLVACTPWAYSDVYTHMLRKYPYRLYRRAALEDEDGNPNVLGESIFPSKLTTKELLDHNKRDTFGFSSQMQCTPTPGEDRSFNPKWIRWGKVVWDDPEKPYFQIRTEDYDPKIVGEATLLDPPPNFVFLSQMKIVVLLDPAPSEESEIQRERGARNGVVVEGMDPWGRRFVLEDWASRVDPLEVINKLFKLTEKWGTNNVGIEEVNFSKLYRYWIRQEQVRRKRFIHVTKLLPGKRDKHTRIKSLIPGHRSGLYYYNHGKTKELVKELAEYPYGSVVDCLDALAYDYKIGRPVSPEEQQAVFAKTRMVGQDRNQMGY